MNKAQAAETYQTNLLQYTATQQRLLQKKNTIAWLRLLVVVATSIAMYVTFSVHPFLCASIAMIGVSVFLAIVRIDVLNEQSIAHNGLLIQINETELGYLKHEFADSINNGSNFTTLYTAHPYAEDLDILGKGSLYHYINRCATEQGALLLAKELLYPTKQVTIQDKQNAIAELENKIDWIQTFMALAKKQSIQQSTELKMKEWLTSKELPFNQSFWKWFLPLFAFIQIAIITLYLLDFITSIQISTWYFTCFIVATSMSKKVLNHHSLLNKIVTEIKVVEQLLLHIKQPKFTAIYLAQLQNQCITKNHTASSAINELKNILQRFDVRLNVYVFLVLNTIFFWDVWQIRALNNWKTNYKTDVEKWFETIATFEVVQSFAITAFNNAHWNFPKINDAFFELTAIEVGHPLIPKNKSVTNNFYTKGIGQITLITGSNMAGKSTFLRSIGCNIVLALAGSKVCASSFSVSEIALMSSMRIADNLAENTSTFYAELKKLRSIIEAVNSKKPVFILLDEILRGTNSLDRHTGSKALITQFIQDKTQAIVATHDVELSKIEALFPENIANYHFDVEVENERLYFDYTLKKGVCNTLNATILMKQIGIMV